jgi:hypothetical protein
MRVIWSGTTSIPTTTRKRTFRPGKLIQAKAYPANAATRMGMTVAGIAIMRRYVKLCPRTARDKK